MRILSRLVTRRGRHGTSFQDHECVGSRVTLGRGTDQDIHLANLRVTLAHAELVQGRDGQVRLQSSVTAGFGHNRVAVQSATVNIGDVIEIGPYQITVVAHQGYDFALEIADTSSARGREFEDALSARARLTLDAAGLRRRPWALGLAFSVLVLFLVVPLISALVPAAGNALRNLPVVPSDHAWLSGTVSQAHAHFADQCERCHTTPFVPTTNAACIACHRQTPHHVEVERLEQGLFAGARCADCHHEHNGRLTIVRADEGLCVNCHGDLRAVAPDTQLHDVTHFGSDHPPFEPLRAAAEDEPGSNRAMPGLEFPHKLHVAAVGIDNADGETVTLGCADCHMPEAGGGLMAPVGFEAHCQSCHRLRIPGDSARELPHGHVAATLASLRDYFAARALAGGYTDVSAPEVVQRRRRPGVELTPAERADALAWAREQATVASREMFVFTSCGLCHQAEPTGAGGEQEWVLAPLGVPHAWLPKSRFSHGQHEAMGCDDCHADVAGSESSADVLLPEIDVCRTCHGGADARAGRLASTCITCHGFHRAKAARLSP